jgi:hypothetical protein
MPGQLSTLDRNCGQGLLNIIIYFDDLLVHSATNKEHLTTLDKVLQHLVQHWIKMNLKECIFWE